MMANRTKKNNRRRKASSSIKEPQELTILNTTPEERKLLNQDMGLRLFANLVMLVAFVSFMWSLWSNAKGIWERVPVWAALSYPIVVGGLFYILKRMIEHQDKQKFERKTLQSHIAASRRWLLVSLLTFSVAIMPLLYTSGVVDGVTSFLVLVFPELGRSVAETLSLLVSIVGSGIVGNFAYEVIKRLIAGKK